MSVKRSFPPVVDRNTRLLVCGSLPGEKSLTAGRYYAHPQNQFWRLMSAVIDLDLIKLDYQAKLDALLHAHVGLWDVVASARREGSSDAAIRDLAANDLATLAISLPDLRAVAFNGATAFRHGAPLVASLPVETVSLPSSSPLHTIGLAAKQPAWAALRTYLGDT